MTTITQPRQHRPRNTAAPATGDGVLATYTATSGDQRVVCTEPGAKGSRLVVDRDAASGADARLLAHLDRDEPAANARLICRRYLEAPRRCRAVTIDDVVGEPLRIEFDPAAAGGTLRAHICDNDLEPRSTLPTAEGSRFRIAPRPGRGEPLPELRWVCDRTDPSDTRDPTDSLDPRDPTDPDAPTLHTVSVRRVIGAVEDYEPARAITYAAIARYRLDRTVSITTLGTELRRLASSPLVLNRALREAVLDAVQRQGVSMSAIALSCGRVKRDRRGNLSGETSWLARRVGLLPDAGAGRPTPWVHTDVLALIARRGLGIDPREVELG